MIAMRGRRLWAGVAGLCSALVLAACATVSQDASSPQESDGSAAASLSPLPSAPLPEQLATVDWPDEASAIEAVFAEFP